MDPTKADDEMHRSEFDPEEIARLAYSFYQARGQAHGYHDEDWFRAEQEMRTRTTARRTVAGVFHSLDDAKLAVGNLLDEGVPTEEISLVANNSVAGNETERAMAAGGSAGETGSNVATDAGIGAALGGVGGLLLSLAGLAIPGVGPVLVAGPIIAALGGAGVGAATGGLVGALTGGGVPEEIATYYAEGVRRGDVLVAVQTSGERADRASRVLNEGGAVNIADRVEDWRKRGWTGYSPEAQALSPAELRREREYYQASRR